MVSWTCQRVVLNWPMFRSRGISRLRDATVRSQAAIRGKFCASCIPKGASDGKIAPSWQHIAAMHPKRADFGKIRAPCIRNALQIAFREYTARRSCHEGVFSLHRPLESCTTRESCHSWVFRLGVAGEVRGEAGRGVPAQRMRLAHAPALCEAARCFRGFTSCSFKLLPAHGQDAPVVALAFA